MNKVLFCVFVIVCLAAPPCQSAIAAKSPNNSPSKQGKELNYYGYGVSRTESSRKDGDRKHGKLHEAGHHHLNVNSKKAKPVYGGASDLKRPRPARNRSSSLLLKPSLFFSSALTHLAVGFICAMFIV